MENDFVKYARDYGYAEFGDVTIPDCEPYDFIPVGTVIKPDDRYEMFIPWLNTWRSARLLETLNQAVVATTWHALRRKISIASPTAMKFSCGHGRDASETHCKVCIVFMRNIITT